MLPKSPRLRRILLAYTVNELGTWFGYVALALGVYDHTHSALAVAGLFIAGRLFPALLTPALVARVEISERRGELSGLYVLEAVAVAALALQLQHFWLPSILILVAIDGTAAMAANALLRAAAARVAVDEIDTSAGTKPLQAEDDAVEIAQRKANAALNVAFTATVALGPALAGVVVAKAGGSTALLIDAVTFMACAALVLNVRSHVEETKDNTIRDRLRTAWRHLRAVPGLRGLLLTEAVALVLFFSVEPVEVLFVKATLRAGDSGFGLLVATWGAGMVLGGSCSPVRCADRWGRCWPAERCWLDWLISDSPWHLHWPSLAWRR